MQAATREAVNDQIGYEADDTIECDMIGFTADASAHILARGLNGAIAVTACDP